MPPLYLWLFVVGCAAAIVAIRWRAPSFDHATANILTLIISFIAVTGLIVWFSLFSGYRQSLRWVTALVATGLIVLLLLSLRIERVSGELIPEFSWRWSLRPDQRLKRPEVTLARQKVDLQTATDADFAEFLGPQRLQRLEGVHLARDWNANPPQQRWRQPIGAGWSAFAVVNGFAVTLEQRGPDELVTCYEALTGKLRWSHAVQARHSTVMGGVGPRSTPTIHEGKVYALGANGLLRCLDGATGKLLWDEDLLKRYGMTTEEDSRRIAWGRAASPLIVDDLVVVPAGGKDGGPLVSLVALDKNSGELVWEGGSRQISYSSPTLATLAGQRQIVIVNEASVTGHDPATGKELWEHPWLGKSNTNANTTQAVRLPDDRVFLSKGYGGGAEVLRVSRDDQDQWTTERLWADETILRTKFSNVVVHDGFVYGLSDGILECVDLQTGQRQWKRGRYGHGQMLAVDDLILVLSESGEMVMLQADPERHQELGSFQALEGQTWNNIALYGPYLLVRNAEQAACYRLPIDDDGTGG